VAISHEARINAFMGASGSGKSAAIKQAITKAKPARLLIWDPQTEYRALGAVVRSLAVLRGELGKAGARGKFALVFAPAADPRLMQKQFDLVCQMVYLAGHATIVAEELSDVTQPAWAPLGWSIVTRKGRHRGLRVYGASQRPAAIDKDFFGNATVIRTGRLNYAADVKTMADVLDVAGDEIRELPALAWIERDMQNGKVRRGKIEF
jgi:hypothetical protein